MDPLADIAVKLEPRLEAVIANDGTGETENKAAQAVRAATGAADAEAARQALKADPDIETKLKAELAQLVATPAAPATLAPPADAETESFQLLQQREKTIQNARELYKEITTTNTFAAWVNPALSVLITLGFIGLVFTLLFRPDDQFDKNQVFNIALGAFATAFATVIGFHFGSSSGSKQKDGVNSLLLAQQEGMKPDAHQK